MPSPKREIADLTAEAKHEALTLVTTEKDLARFWTNGAVPSWAEEIVPFAVTLAFDDPARYGGS